MDNEQNKYGCHCENIHNPYLYCLLDRGFENDCKYAKGIKRKENCEHWRLIKNENNIKDDIKNDITEMKLKIGSLAMDADGTKEIINSLMENQEDNNLRISEIEEAQKRSQSIESAEIDINVGPITQVIREFADDLEYHAKELRIIAKDMDDTGDISFGIDALIEINQAFSSLRIDLLLRRTIKELQKNK